MAPRKHRQPGPANRGEVFRMAVQAEGRVARARKLCWLKSLVLLVVITLAGGT